MKIEIMIYVYIAICVSMIAYNAVYVFILRHRGNSLMTNTRKLEALILEQMKKIDSGESVLEKHKTYLRKVLQRTAYIMAFDKALELISKTEPQLTEKYLMEIYPVFEYLTHKYISKDTLKIAYFPYILQKYDILRFGENSQVTDILFELLRSVNVYCRENTLKALYSMQDETVVAKALKIIDQNLSFHHPKLICDGLLTFSGDKQKLKECLLNQFDGYSVQMQLNILNFFRFGSIRCDGIMLSILKDEKQDPELHFSAIRYFEKYPNDEAKSVIQSFAENIEGLSWEYQAIASSALKSYPTDDTFRILTKNLSNSNWHVRLNSAISCEKLGYTYHDLINIFDGNDRYAREILRYRLERRKTEETAVKA